MITTINEIIKSQGWEQGKMIMTDIWIGKNCIRHIYKVLVIDENELYMRSDKFLFVSQTPEIIESNESCTLRYRPDESIVKVHTKAEAIADAKLMDSIRKEQSANAMEKRMDYVKACLEGIDKALENTSYTEKKEIAEKLGDLGKYDEYVEFMLSAGYHNEKDVIDEDVEYWIRRIFRDRSFTFTDEDNEGISTFVDLRHAVSVETECEYDDKECVHLTMVNGTTYNVYMESDKELYLALETLYKA